MFRFLTLSPPRGQRNNYPCFLPLREALIIHGWSCKKREQRVLWLSPMSSRCLVLRYQKGFQGQFPTLSFLAASGNTGATQTQSDKPHVLSHLSFLALSSAISIQPPVTAETRIKKTTVVGSRKTRRTQGIEGGTWKRGGL